MQKPELNTVLSNIGSLVDEAKMMIGNESPKEGEEEKKPEEMVEPELAKSILKWLKAQEDEGSEEDKKEDKKEDEEEAMAKSDEGTHGDDKAEEIVDDQGDVNEKNINDVAKAIVRSLISMKQPVKKSAHPDNVLKKSLDAVRSENAEIKQALSNILEGMGIAEQIKIQNSTLEKSLDSKKIPNDPNELAKSIEFIREALGVNVAKETTPHSGDLRKSLTADGGKMLTGLFQVNRNAMQK